MRHSLLQRTLHQLSINLLQIHHIILQLLTFFTLLSYHLQSSLIPTLHVVHIFLNVTQLLCRLPYSIHLTHQSHHLIPCLIPLSQQPCHFLPTRRLFHLKPPHRRTHALNELHARSRASSRHRDELSSGALWARAHSVSVIVNIRRHSRRRR